MLDLTITNDVYYVNFMDHSTNGSIYSVSIMCTLMYFIRSWVQCVLHLHQTPSLGSPWYWFFLFTSPFCTDVVFFVYSSHNFLFPVVSYGQLFLFSSCVFTFRLLSCYPVPRFCYTVSSVFALQFKINSVFP